jgi:two-component system LytT family response regulator
VTIRALIVDDEPLARERLRTLLAAEPDIELVGECTNGKEALAAITRSRPDLVFLDVQMPERDGFQVLSDLGPTRMPSVIFVTAYDRFALQAFEVHALDYLLKPFDRVRFSRALHHARQQLAREPATDRLVALLEDLEAARRGPERLVIRDAGRVFFLPITEIEWIEAAGNYARLHCGRETHLLRETMKALEARLDPTRFARVHRSAIVNLDRIQELRPSFHGEYEVVLKSGARVTSSRNHSARLQELARGRE